MAPNGCITFLSKPFGGRSSDAFITTQSNFLQLLEDGDKVLADKGFPTIDSANGVVMVIPPRAKRGQKYATADQMKLTKEIARVPLVNYPVLLLTLCFSLGESSC